MPTLADNLRKQAEKLRELLRTFLLEHSALKPHFEEVYPCGILDSQLRGLPSKRQYAYSEYQKLDLPGLVIQSNLRSEYCNFQELMRSLFSGASQEVTRTLDSAERQVSSTIDHTRTQWKTAAEALDAATQALDSEVALLDLFSRSDGSDFLLLPDTNALLENQNLEKWKFEGIPKFTLILLPTLLGELDCLKVNHRSPEIQNKARSIIKRIKEYRRRGNLLKGVNVVRGTSRIRSLAVEPDLEKSPSWLNRDNNDDRFLASVIEVIRSNPHSDVAIITGDINLQNKADFCGVPYLEPPTLDEVSERE